MAKGDQIYAYREFFTIPGVYQHHGIDCGDGTVIHYRKPSEIIQRTSIETFARGNPIYVKQYAQGFCFIPDVVVERAASRLGENNYNLLFNNCEHFANWCKTGFSDSRQVRDFVPTINRLDVERLSQPLKTALNHTSQSNAENLVAQALNDVRTVWDQIQPQYQKALSEQQAWQQVAEAAVKRNRDDLARAALLRKRNYAQQAQKLEDQLNQLAKMTENLVRQRLSHNSSPIAV